MSKHYIPIDNEGKQSPEQYAKEILAHNEAFLGTAYHIKEKLPKDEKAVKNYTYINELE